MLTASWLPKKPQHPYCTGAPSCHQSNRIAYPSTQQVLAALAVPGEAFDAHVRPEMCGARTRETLRS